MLVMSRMLGESILIGDYIEIKIVRISNDRVRLGITAPRNISVYRREVYEAIANEQRRTLLDMATVPGSVHAEKIIEFVSLELASSGLSLDEHGGLVGDTDLNVPVLGSTTRESA